MILDSKLDFQSHVREAIVKARRGIGMVRYLSRYISREVLDVIYKLHVRPHLDYGDSDHCLAIEKGRHSKPPVIIEERFCKFCPNIIEDEKHFILSRNTYNTERAIFISQINTIYPNFIKIPTGKQKMIFLFTNDDKQYLQIFAEYLDRIYKIRLDSP